MSFEDENEKKAQEIKSACAVLGGCFGIAIGLSLTTGDPLGYKLIAVLVCVPIGAAVGRLCGWLFSGENFD